MNITPISIANQYQNNTTFGAKMHGITVPQKTKNEIAELAKEFNKVIGNETHNSSTPIGKCRAIYSKWSDSFRIDPDKDTSVSISTYKGKIHSFSLFHSEEQKGKNSLQVFDVYNGCKDAPNPVPNVEYSEMIGQDVLGRYTAAYKPGDKMSQADSQKIEQLIDIISKKLGLK